MAATRPLSLDITASCSVLLAASLAAGLLGCGDSEQSVEPGITPADAISQNGVTWGFAQTVESGTFANGDPWVVAPVTIVQVTPEPAVMVWDLGDDICVGDYTARDCTDRCDEQHPGTAALCSEGGEPNSQGACWCIHGRDGWQSNPQAGRVTSAFDSRVGHHAFDHRLMPALPYEAAAGESLIKVASREEGLEDDRPSVQSASVLTVLAEPPPDAGTTVFRPPYVGTDKPLYRTTDLRTDLLPSYAPLAQMPSWEEVEAHVRYVQLEHIAGRAGVIIRPQDHLYYYAPENGGRRAEVALRLMIDEPLENRMQALVYFVQGGIDMVHALAIGQTWGAGGGEYPGMKLIMLFAGIMLDEPALVQLVEEFESYEDESVSYGTDDQALWGHIYGYGDQETGYWRDVVNELLPDAEPSRKTLRDPYGYIDGGTVPGTGYQICCTIQPFKGTSLAMLLMPELQDHWDIPALHDYADRMVTHGALAQPDPCAPPDPADIAAGLGIEDPGTHYGITYGPDGAGGCIADANPADGVGRFPEQDGVEQDPQSYHGSSALVHAMWEAYRESAGN